MSRLARLAAAGVAAAALAACKPDLGDPASLVTEPRILAVRSDPAEVEPTHMVAYQALIATPTGAPSTPADIAYGVLFFASEYAGWITGQVMSIDGGK